MTQTDENPSVFNGHFELDITIDRPVEIVWKGFIEIGTWVTSHLIENVKGVPGQVGSITRVTWGLAKQHGMPAPHYHYCKIIELIPHRQYVLKTFAEQGGSYGMEIVAFDDTRFIDLGGQTKVVFNFYGEIKAEAVAKDPAAMNLDGSKEGMLNNLKNLKRIVESQ